MMQLQTIYFDQLYLQLHKYGKKHFEFESNIIRCIADSLIVLDKHNYITPTKSYDEYFFKAKEVDNFEMLSLWTKHAIYFHKNKQYDFNLPLETKKELLLNTVSSLAKEFINSSGIKKYDKSSLKQDHIDILENLKAKIDDDKSLRKILELLEEYGLNFYINLGEIAFYPIITDILRDTFTQEFYDEDKKKIIQSMKTEFSLVQREQKEDKFLPVDLYNKIYFHELVHYDKTHMFIMHDQAHKLNLNVEEYRKLYREILYYDTDKDKDTPSLGFGIKELSKKMFVSNLEYTKLVI